MKTLLSLLLLLALLACTKEPETCQCPKEPTGYFPFGIRTLFFPINSTAMPAYAVSGDTVAMELYLSFRNFIDMPPRQTGLDYYRYEMDLTEFRSAGFGLFYQATAGSEITGRLSVMKIDWFAVKAADTLYQPCSMVFNLPVDSNGTTQQAVLLDSVQVSGKWYGKVLSGPVVTSPAAGGPAYPGAVPVRYYYSTDCGIVRLDMTDGTHWDLVAGEQPYPRYAFR